MVTLLDDGLVVEVINGLKGTHKRADSNPIARLT